MGLNSVTLNVISLGHQIINAVITKLIAVTSTTGVAKVPFLMLVLGMIKERVRW